MAQTNVVSIIPETTLNLIDVLRIFKKNLKWILLIAFSVAAIVGVWNRIYSKPYFISKASLISSNKDSITLPGSVSQALAQARGANNELLQYEKILETTNLASLVSAELKFVSVAQLRKNLSVRVDGPTLELQYTGSKPAEAAQIIQSYLSHLDDFLQTSFTEKARSNETFIKARLSEAESALKQLERGISQLKFSEANRELQTQTKVVMLLREQYELAQIESKKQQQYYLVIDPPTIPELPAGPNRMLNIILAFVISLFIATFFGVAVSLVRREIDRGPHSAS